MQLPYGQVSVFLETPPFRLPLLMMQICKSLVNGKPCGQCTFTLLHKFTLQYLEFCNLLYVMLGLLSETSYEDVAIYACCATISCNGEVRAQMKIVDEHNKFQMDKVMCVALGSLWLQTHYIFGDLEEKVRITADALNYATSSEDLKSAIFILLECIIPG